MRHALKKQARCNAPRLSLSHFFMHFFHQLTPDATAVFDGSLLSPPSGAVLRTWPSGSEVCDWMSVYVSMWGISMAPLHGHLAARG